MTKRLVGLIASVALMGSGVAMAKEDLKSPQHQQQTGAQGGSGSVGAGQSGSSSAGMGQTGSGSVGAGQSGSIGGSGQQQMGTSELTGRVVKADSKTVWVDHMGAIVPLKIDRNTQFVDPNLKRARDIKEGTEIRASFEVKNTENLARSIQPATGSATGGSGVMSPDSSINQDKSTLPPATPGTGGSGDLGQDINNQDTGAGMDRGTGGSDKTF